jgi:hypothetical protein
LLRRGAGIRIIAPVGRPLRMTVTVLTLALVGGAAVAATAVNATSCLAKIRDDGTFPPCCRRPARDQVSDARHSCCVEASTDFGDPSATPSTPAEVPAAPVAALPSLSADDVFAAFAATARCQPQVERPPDRSPPTGTTVLLI